MRRRTCLTVLVSVLALSACGDSGTGPDDISGLYELRTINGVALPFTIIQIGSDSAEFTSGFLQLNANRTYTFSITTSATTGGSTETVTETDLGTWFRQGNQVSITPFSDGSTITVVISGNEIVMIDDDLSLTFRK